MKGPSPFSFQPWKTWQLTLRTGLVFWVAGLLFVFSLTLILFINVTATVTVSRSSALFVMPVPPLPTPATEQSALWTPLPELQEADVPSPITSAIEIAQQAALRQVRRISFIGLGLISVMGGIGAYWLAGHALRPVRQVSQAARRISAGTLDIRLALDRPDDELKELADSFDTMLDRLEHAFRQQARFVADAAHELRTPLSVLRTNLEVIRADPMATLDDYQELGEVLERTLARLERLVADLLLLATEERPPMDETALGPLLEDVLLDLKSLTEVRQVELRHTGDASVTVPGNALLLARAFTNLIENGIRYNHPGGEVMVTIRRDGAWAVVTIADTGIGIPSEEQGHVFERFYRVDRSRERHRGGAGLGLSIVAHIVQQHGGQVQVESIPGIGSTFTVRLPL